MTGAEKLPFTAQDYLDWERQQTTKHEFVRGETFAMAGADDAHVTISLNVAAALKQHLRSTPCRTYIADMKVCAPGGGCIFLPRCVRDLLGHRRAAQRRQGRTHPGGGSAVAHHRGLRPGVEQRGPYNAHGRGLRRRAQGIKPDYPRPSPPNLAANRVKRGGVGPI